MVAAIGAIRQGISKALKNGMQTNPTLYNSRSSASTIIYLTGHAKIKAIVGVREMTLLETSEIIPMHVPMANNRATDKMADLAIQIMTKPGDRPRENHQPPIAIELIDDKHVLTIQQDLASLSCMQVEEIRWKQALDQVTPWEASELAWNGMGGIKYQWTALRFEITHAAYCAAEILQ